MDKLFRLRRPNSWCRLGVSRVSTFCGGFYTSTSHPDPADTIYRRISKAGYPTNSMAAILDQWLEQGRDLKQSDLQGLVKMLRRYNRYGHALQVSEWMSDQRNHQVSPRDIAIRLDLISRVHGLEQMEKYFNGIPDDLRGLQVYGALLNCYAYHKYLEKAEALMLKMREFGFLKTTLSYNVMLKLYFQLSKIEKLEMLLQEMEQNGIKHDKFTCSIQLNAYGATANIEGMEKLLSRMAVNPDLTLDWHVYVTAAKWYLKAGLIEKGLTMVRKSEPIISGKSKRIAYETLLTLYATAGEIDEVYRMWNLCKNLGKVYNSSYLCMISSLMRLDEINGAEIIFKEWESEQQFFDARVPNVMISAYCRKGHLEKAEAYVDRFVESGNDPDATTWDRLATGYHANGQMAKSVEAMKKAILADRPGWKPNTITLAAILEYLKQQDDVGAAEEEFLKLLQERGHSSTGINDKLGSNFNKETLHFEAIDEMEREDTLLDDIEGAEKIFEEWESQCSTVCENRILICLLIAYCIEGLFEKAESVVNKALKGGKPHASLWNVLAMGYKGGNQMSKAVEMLKWALSVGKQWWSPNSVTLDSCLDYSEGQGDVGGAEDMIRLLKMLGSLTRDIYHRWPRICVAAGASVLVYLPVKKHTRSLNLGLAHSLLELFA
ncbi:hypothetical protein LWI29_025038 [Acer saccharum]|uniref:Pentatricopeptide repeat-containing protein n=1 Tax=Acer saccharum TaxID=4024 RepID=A0AA39VTP0_ACESA|nr:hypothetical protein LWI29_025038 [Acer saccharum]